eukprot:TRINITY_DN23199_c0_g1_i3.p1 TRINITY_DN23199_c0_g1~~TRINITY_DN23199_c0_g1_i3.p1  ORF type:complete len:611 (+),score=111.66 TRINITY_DN23199_c0_g1_i3:22-1854(+)
MARILCWAVLLSALPPGPPCLRCAASHAVEETQAAADAVAHAKEHAEASATEHAAGEHSEHEMVEEHGEEHEEFTRVDLGCSWMLVSSFLFGIVVFYFVNYPDSDIKRYSWSIINTTLSIFTAVLIFTGVDELILQLVITPLLGAFPRGAKEIIRVLIGFCIFLVWLVAMHLLVAFASNALLKKTGVGIANVPCYRDRQRGEEWVVCDGLRGDHGRPVHAPGYLDPEHRWQILQVSIPDSGEILHVHRSVAVNEEGEEVYICRKDTGKQLFEHWTKSAGMLFAHMAGFAMISAGGDLQHAPPFADAPLLSLLSVAISVLFLLACFWCAAKLRHAEEEEDEHPEHRHAVDLYNEQVAEAEDDIFSLAISFLLVQAFKYGITGRIPDKLGLDTSEEFSAGEILALYGSGLLCVVLGAAIVFLRRKGRPGHLAVSTLCMSFAWCILFASRWLFKSWPFLRDRNISPQTIEGRMVLAMTLSVFSAVFIIFLDKIEDANPHQRETHKIVKSAVTGLSILIGFSWEHAMDGSVEAIASAWDEHRRLLAKLLGMLIICLVVLPAWRKFILVKHLELEQRFADRERRTKQERKKLLDNDSDSEEKLTSSEEELSEELK